MLKADQSKRTEIFVTILSLYFWPIKSFRLEMLAEIVFEKINFGKQFRIYNTFYNKGHQKIT